MSFMCGFSHIYNVLVVLTFVCVISYIYNVPIFLLFMDSLCSSRWPSLSFFRSCPAPVFPIYDPPPPWTVYSDHSCPVSHHLVLFPFEFRFVCFVSRSKVKKFDDQACPFFVHVRLRSFRSMHPPPPHPVSTILSVLYMRGWGREGSGRAMAHGWLRLVLWCS